MRKSFTKILCGCLVAVFIAAGSARAQERAIGYIVAWGANDHGQCDVPSPCAEFVAIAAGVNHCLALRYDGSVVEWGDGAAEQGPDPNSDFVAIAVYGDQNYGLKSDGSLVNWPGDPYSRCIAPPENCSAVAGGMQGVIAVSAADGYLWNCGTFDYPPPPGTPFVQVAVGYEHAVGLTLWGSIATWGTDHDCEVTCILKDNYDFVAVAAGKYLSLSLKSLYAAQDPGAIRVWGNDDFNQWDVPEPNAGFVAVSAFENHVLALRSDLSIEAWGDNTSGQCNVPEPNEDFVDISAGQNYSLALKRGTAPKGNAGPDQSIQHGETVYLDGTGSYDDNTETGNLVYSWTLRSRPEGSSATLTDADTATPSFVADRPGSYEAELMVFDTNCLFSKPDLVVISSLNLAPTADAGPDRGVIVARSVQLDGTESFDPNGDQLVYSWSIAEAPEGSITTLLGANTATPFFSPDLPGQYTVELIVSDGFEDSEPDQATVSAVTTDDVTESIAFSLDIVTGLPLSSVTTKGNRTALGRFLSEAIRFIEQGNIDTATVKLQAALRRTDGCELRGAPDGGGEGRDWITDCDAQDQIYGLLEAVLDAISF